MTTTASESLLQRPLNWTERLTNILDEAEDMLTDAEEYAEDSGDRAARAVWHKLQEAIGPLRKAHAAAEEARL